MAADQRSDGSWRLDAAQSAGAPATYGTALATWAARRTLVAAATPANQPAIERADRWLRTFDANNIPDAGGILLGLERATDAAASAPRGRARALLRHRARQDASRRPPVTGRKLARNDASGGTGEPCAADFDRRMGRAGAPGVSRQGTALEIVETLNIPRAVNR